MKNPLPCLAVIAAASLREKPDLRASTPVVSICEILNGRGNVTRLELGADPIDVPALPATKE